MFAQTIKHTLIAAATLTGLTAVAHADADLEVTFDAPSSTALYAVGRYKVVVANIGDAHAKNSTVRIDLPTTNTSPTVYVMGDVNGVNNKCSVVGLSVECTLNRVRKGRSKTVWVDIALPASAADIEFFAEAETTSAESNTGNNSATHIAVHTAFNTPISGPVDVHNRHCTGQNLTAFFECETAPSSISSHDAVYHANNTITFPGQPATFSGTWTQPSADTLEFAYTDSGNVVAEFSGVGVGGDCFEGLTTFPGSGWVAPYEVCLQ